MKVITKTKIVYEDGDKEIIFSRMPEDPCDTCSMGVACCGCPDGRKYSEDIKIYKERGVFELAKKVNRYYKLGRKIKKLEEERAEIEKELADIGLDVTEASKYMED